MDESLKTFEMDAQAFVHSNGSRILDDILSDESFMKDASVIRKIRYWIKDVTTALSYLHGKDLCYLSDLKKKVVISPDGYAILSNFQYLGNTNTFTKNFDIPHYCKPPEACSGNLDENAAVEGKAFDVWCLGMMVKEIFNQFDTKPKRYPKISEWMTTKAPTVKKFAKRCRAAFPTCRGEILKSMRDFASQCLRLFPKDRPSAASLLKHKFLDVKESSRPQRDSWIKKVKLNILRKITDDISNYKDQDPMLVVKSVAAIYEKTDVSFYQESGDHPNGDLKELAKETPLNDMHGSEVIPEKSEIVLDKETKTCFGCNIVNELYSFCH